MADRKCAKLTSCSDTEYESVANTGSSDRKCAKATVCKSSEYEAKARTSTSNRVCKPISDCKPGTFVATKATKTADRVCKACGDDAYTDGDNAPACKDQPQCGAGELISTATAQALRKCSGCPTKTFQAKAQHRDTKCVAITSCPAGTAIDKDFTAKTDRTIATSKPFFARATTSQFFKKPSRVPRPITAGTAEVAQTLSARNGTLGQCRR